MDWFTYLYKLFQYCLVNINWSLLPHLLIGFLKGVSYMVISLLLIKFLFGKRQQRLYMKWFQRIINLYQAYHHQFIFHNRNTWQLLLRKISSEGFKRISLFIRKYSIFITFCLGICTASSNEDLHLHNRLLLLETHLQEKSSSNISHDEEGLKVWFVISTKFNKMQEPSLVRIAQSLYPIRQHIEWIIVNEDINMKNHTAHLEYLNSMLYRFSIPYILLSLPHSSKSVDFINNNWFSWIYYKFIQDDLSLRARYLGGIWILQNVRKGVLLFGDTDFTFHHKLFLEVQDTENVSIWPVELQEADNKHKFLKTYNNKCQLKNIDDMKITLGGVAININYLKKRLDRYGILNYLCQDLLYDIGQLGDIRNIQPLKSCNMTFVWRTKLWDNRQLKKPWPLKEVFHNTNAEYLLRYIYREDFDNKICMKNCPSKK